MKSRTKENDKGLNLGLISGSIIGAIIVLGIILFIIFVVYRRIKRSKDPEKADDNPDSRTEGVSSGWTKKDIRVLFGSMKSSEKPQSASTKYQPCNTEEKFIPTNEFKMMRMKLSTLLLPFPPTLTIHN
ncbi:hypothetical protein TNIN_498001 [Trichonephila inaurata madagascariensis]|uniref:Uncharacterized protein n=1 Tax=Trichonephila inaurata madagascariensis TaxID=2747483 RepID=A0A8X6IB93_9ARAC|nr:hypothetical protein TNIN_498001 [Trichonephila inaurata madagascariensis]